MFFILRDNNDQWCCLHPRMVQGLNMEGELFIRPLAMDFPEDPKAQTGLKTNLVKQNLLRTYQKETTFTIWKWHFFWGWAGGLNFF